MSRQNPWSLVPTATYETFLGPQGLDLLAPLATIFGKALADIRPRRLLVRGVATGNGLEHVDPAVTKRVVGVDVNIQYIAIARQRHMRLGPSLELYCADVDKVSLDAGGFDLCWAALVFEHVDAAPLAERISGWLAPGGALLAVLDVTPPESAPEAPRDPTIQAVVDAERG